MSKEYIKSLIEIGETLLKEGSVKDALGKKVCGDYWTSVKQDMIKNARVEFVRGELQVLSHQHLKAYLQQCRDECTSIIEKEKDRQLDNDSKIAAIKANKIAKWAIGISLLAATGLPQWILKWLYERVACILGFQ